ncbi:MAG TPA: hypothetical protein VKR54_00850 [Candidatus Babeliales bacterium]|jgi:hypothetical protein|nr:hypothetical protein [Candidatus Babeliales bacterium]
MKNIKNSQKNNKPAMLVALLAVFVVINIFPTRAPVQVEPPRRQLQPVTAAEVLAGATTLKLKQQKQGVIIVLDDSEKDSLGIGPAKGVLLTALYQEAASIIVSASLLAPLFEQRLKDKRNVNIMLDEFQKEFKNWDNPIDSERYAVLANRIAFDPERWIIKKISDVLMLLIPRTYLVTLNISADKVEEYNSAAVLSDVELQLGFRVNHMQTIDFRLMNSFNRPRPEGFVDYFIDSLDSIFCQKSDYKDRQISIPSFIMCLYGHGLTNRSIAGLSLDGFKKLLNFLESKIMMQLLVVLSCYAAGFNTHKIYGEMRLGTQQYYSFPIIVQGLNDLAVISESFSFKGNSQNQKIQLISPDDFVSFFKKAKELEGSYSEIIKPISENFVNNTPQIKLPGAEWFSVIEGDKKIVSIGSVLAKTRDPQKPLNIVNFFKKDPEIILLYTEEIPFGLVINSSNLKSIVSMVSSGPRPTNPEFVVHRIKKMSSTTRDFFEMVSWFESIGNSNEAKSVFIDEIYDNNNDFYSDILIIGTLMQGAKAYFKYKGNVLLGVELKGKNSKIWEIKQDSDDEKIYADRVRFIQKWYPIFSTREKTVRQEITPEQIEKIKNVIIKQREQQKQEAKK